MDELLDMVIVSSVFTTILMAIGAWRVTSSDAKARPSGIFYALIAIWSVLVSIMHILVKGCGQ